MELSRDIEILNLMTQKLIQEKQSEVDDDFILIHKKQSKDDVFMEDDEEQLLLSRLISQIDSLKANGKLKQSEESIERQEENSPVEVEGEADARNKNVGQLDSEHGKISLEEIAKELRVIKRQNTKTHWLLSAMFVLTVVWQLSEVSLILKVKDGISHPFRSFGSMLAGMLRGPGTNDQDAEKQFLSTKKHNSNHIEAPHVEFPPLKMRKLPHVDLADIGLNSEKN